MTIVLRINDIDPDGVPIRAPWDTLEIDQSVFIPCLNHDKARKQIAKIARRLKIKVSIKTRIESGKWGLRVWRTM